jgi:CheY-like chemotaxis protein
MPIMDGYEVARRLRATPHGRSAMLAALTGWAQESDRERVRNAGFDAHLVKPVELSALESLLTTLDLNGQRHPAAITSTQETVAPLN